MSRKLFSFLSDQKSKQKTIKVVEETGEGSHFERRVSVSNSGRWKQKNKHRSVLNDDIFASPKNENSSKDMRQNQQNVINKSNCFDDNKCSYTTNENRQVEDKSKLETAF